MNEKYQRIFNTVISFARSNSYEIRRIDIQTGMINTRFEHVAAYATFDNGRMWIFRGDGTFEEVTD